MAKIIKIRQNGDQNVPDGQTTGASSETFQTAHV
jgi:hypothetical protein